MSAVPGLAVPGRAVPGLAGAATPPVASARYATTTFSIQLPSGGSDLVIKGARRSSTHPAVTGAPALFATAPPVLGQDVSPTLYYWLTEVNPAGTEL